ncbi:hypothetical protein D4Q85_00940 [bacterium]|nr:MAG: hypothetical protein D4Q85_00940 [bacterium]
MLVPAAELPGVLALLGGEWDRRETLVEQSSRWSIAAVGSAWRGSRATQFNDGAVHLGSGRLRLLMRSWVAPGERIDSMTDPAFAAVMRVALVLQHEEPVRSPDSPLVLRPAQLRQIEDDGQIFNSLSIEVSLVRGQALLLVPEIPECDWNTRSGDAGPSEAQESADQVAETGPPKAELRTVGEYLLSDATPLRRWTRRSILVFTGQAPARYELIPKS